MMEGIARHLVAMAVMVAIACAVSMNRRAIRVRTVAAALAVQVGIGALVLFVPAGRQLLFGMAKGVNHVLDYGQAGIGFLFGALVGQKMFGVFGSEGFVFAFRVLPMIIFATALISVLYYLGVMRWVVWALGTLFQKLLGVSRMESFSAVTTIFLGQSDMPAVIKPFVRGLTGAELFAVMASGMASISGSVLAGYVGLGVKLEYLLAASFMAVPGGLLFAKLVCPSTEPGLVVEGEIHFDEHRPANVIAAASSGAAVGMRVAVLVGTMLIAFIGLISLVNGIVGGVGGWFGWPALSLEAIFGWVFAPLAWLLGVPWEQAPLAGNFIGQKMILNEFVAYANLAPYLKDAADGAASAGRVLMDPKTLVVLSFALCGWANFSSIGVMVGAFGAVAPERASEAAGYGLRVVVAATLSNLMSANIAGLFYSLR